MKLFLRIVFKRFIANCKMYVLEIWYNKKVDKMGYQLNNTDKSISVKKFIYWFKNICYFEDIVIEWCD